MSSVISWIYPLVEVALIVFCSTQIRGKGGSLLAAGFGVSLFGSLAWRLAGLLGLYSEFDYEVVNEVLQVVGLLTRFGFAALFVVGVSQLAKTSVDSTSDATGLRMGQPIESTGDLGRTSIYLVTLGVGSILVVIGAVASEERSSEGVGIAIMVLGIAVFLAAQIYLFVLLYRLWKFAISQSFEHGLTPSIDSPGKAVGCMFIPFYNFYWVFQAYGKLPKDLNALARAKGEPDVASEGMGTAIAVLTLVGIIPLVGYVTAVVSSFILTPLFLSDALDMCQRLSRGTTTGPAAPGSFDTPGSIEVPVSSEVT